MNKNVLRRLSAGLLSLALLLSLGLPGALAAGDPQVIHISTKEDWLQLVKNCRLDSWSQDKVVLLDNDLDLSGVSSIPTFGGTFDGGGHTVSSFCITAEGDHLGLFRYVQEGADVRNLTLKGTVVPSGRLDTVGGIAGVNSGVIENCVFEGFLSGGSGVGGMAGYNGAAGQIIGCENRSGVVSGEHSTGGIVGVNQGTVTGCTNAAQINTQESAITPQLEGVDWNKLNSTENVPACTDVGGIAGYSAGVLKDCSNSGTVGYPHTGYNVGGVAGRQSGYMSGCSNSGAVRGRKEVGGIVGQMEPFTQLRYEEDTLQKLSRELENLSSLMSGALDSTDRTRQELSGHISALTGQTKLAKDQISVLLDDIEDMGSGTVDTLNELSRRVDRCLEQLTPVAKEMEQSSGRLSSALGSLEDMSAHLDASDASFHDALKHFRTALEQVDSALRTLLTGVPSLLSPGHGTLIPGAEELQHILDQLGAMADSLPQAMDELEEAFKELNRAADRLDSGDACIRAALDDMSSAMSQLQSGSDHVADAFGGLRKAVEEQSQLPPLELPRLDPDFGAREEELSGTLTGLLDQLEAMNQSANRGGEALSGQLRKFGSQFDRITQVLRSSKEDQDTEDKVIDVSDENIASAVQGKVTGCSNSGSVAGDVNVGGVTGSMAIEYDFDPEDDVTDQGGRSMNFQFLTRVILQGCVNTGSVEARKDCAGGAVGRMELGVAAACENYGSVKSVSGEMVGGIAGSSRGVIRDSWSKCALSGTRRIGGVAGFAVDVRDCRTLVDITSGSSYLGAVIGDADRNCTLSGNLFVSEELGGVDGVSYAGKAEPMAYEDFIAQAGIPEFFSALTVTFVADGEAVALVTVPYGGSVSEEMIPQVPPREGFRGVWSGFDAENIRFDTEVEALYSPLLSAIASSDNSVMAEGLFTPEAVLSRSECTQKPPEHGGEPFVVDCSEPFTALRIAIPEDCKRAGLMQLDGDGSWQPLKTEQDGSFLRAELTGSRATLCLVSSDRHAGLWALPVIAAAAVLAAVLIRRKHRRSPSEPTDESAPQT